MKRTLLSAVLALFFSVMAYSGIKNQPFATVVFATNMSCKACQNKVDENIPFEKGVKDFQSSLEKQTITITFNSSKTDTVKLAAAIRKLGYSAKVIEFKEK